MLALVAEPEGFRGFVDPSSPRDPYPRAMWTQFGAYLTRLMSEGTDAEAYVFARGRRGRYGMACELRARGHSEWVAA